jgi:hypothetical protein
MLGGNQGSLVFLVAGLPATFLLRLAFRRLWPGVWMLRTGRQRRILRRLAFHLPFPLPNPRFQLGNLRQQHPDDGLGLRRLAGDDFFRDSQQHATVVAERRPPCPDQFVKQTPPGRERLRGCHAKAPRKKIEGRRYETEDRTDVDSSLLSAAQRLRGSLHSLRSVSCFLSRPLLFPVSCLFSSSRLGAFA